MITRSASYAPARNAPPSVLHPASYQDVLKQLAVVTLIAALPGAGLAARGWLGKARMRRSWPPGAQR